MATWLCTCARGPSLTSWVPPARHGGHHNPVVRHAPVSEPPETVVRHAPVSGHPMRRSTASHLNIHSIYWPPIRPGENDHRTGNLDPSAIPTIRDILLFGDWNVHQPDWDPHAEEDVTVRFPPHGPSKGRKCYNYYNTGRLLADWIIQSVMVTVNDGSHTHTSYHGNLSTPDAVFCHRDLSRRCTWSGCEYRQ